MRVRNITRACTKGRLTPTLCNGDVRDNAVGPLYPDGCMYHVLRVIPPLYRIPNILKMKLRAFGLRSNCLFLRLDPLHKTAHTCPPRSCQVQTKSFSILRPDLPPLWIPFEYRYHSRPKFSTRNPYSSPGRRRNVSVTLICQSVVRTAATNYAPSQLFAIYDTSGLKAS